MHVRIRNIMALERVEMRLQGLTLVGGFNEAGKTTLLQCIAAAALGEWKMRGVAQKGGLAAILRRSAADASILLEHADGSVRISYPDGRVERQGADGALGTPLGIGAAPFMGLSAEDRRLEIAERFNTAPTREDFDAWWRTHPQAGLNPDGKPEDGAFQGVQVLWDDIGVSGWDTVAKRIENGIKQLTGQWREVTGVAWGTKIRLTWAPEGLFRDEEYSITEATDAHKAAREALETLLRQDAVDLANKAALDERAAEVPALQADLAEAQNALAAANAAVEEAIETLENTPEPTDPRSLPACPECNKALLIVRTGNGMLTLQKPTGKHLSVQSYTDALTMRTAAQQVLDTRRAEVDDLSRRVVRISHDLAGAQEAAAAAARMAGKPAIDAEGIAAARKVETAALARVRAIEALQRVQQINVEWERGQAIHDGLLPSGIRANVLQRKLAEINVTLGAVAAGAGMREVGMTDACALTYDGYPYAMLSESAQWRCNVAMGLMLAKQEGARVFLVDRLDLLQAQSRPGVLQALSRLGIPTVATMTSRDPHPPILPDLAAHKLGRTIWLGGGKFIEQGA